MGANEDLGRLATEQVNPETTDLDQRDTMGVLQAMSAEDQRAVRAVRAVLPAVAQAVEIVADRLARGGRLFYVGAGTSGRLGVLDASECPPTFGVPPTLVQGIIAGGEPALRRSSEGMEDHPRLGAHDIAAAGVGDLDVVVGISASGRAPYVVGALAAARRRGAATIAIANHKPAAIAADVDVAILPLTGPEVLAGSTRLKAGTSQKLVLNMITTAAFVRMGYVYRNWMVDMRPTNLKLRARAVRIIQQAAEVPEDEARRLLKASRGSVKVALVMAATGTGRVGAERLLAEAGGRVRKAIGAAVDESTTKTPAPNRPVGSG